ncbi:MAG: 5-formyltetrahydrofolate cyclo-ligase [Gillisia sp.]
MKNKLRLKYKELRQQFSSEEIEEKSVEIANNLLQMDIWQYTYYHIFLSISEKKEVDTEPVLHILQGKDKEILISKSDFTTREMHHFLLTDSTKLQKNKWNIPEPSGGIEISSEKIEVVFLPLLAFDKIGHRVGYGMGFYDKFLQSCRPEVLKIGLSLFEPEERIPGILSTDVPLDYCVTPNKIYSFKK